MIEHFRITNHYDEDHGIPEQAIDLQRGMVFYNHYKNSLFVFLDRNVKKCWGWHVEENFICSEVSTPEQLTKDSKIEYIGTLNLPKIIMNSKTEFVDPKSNEKLMKIFKKTGDPQAQFVGVAGVEI